MPKRKVPFQVSKQNLPMQQNKYNREAERKIRQELQAQRLMKAQQLQRAQQDETAPQLEEEKKSKRRIIRFWTFLRRS